MGVRSSKLFSTKLVHKGLENGLENADYWWKRLLGPVEIIISVFFQARPQDAMVLEGQCRNLSGKVQLFSLG